MRTVTDALTCAASPADAEALWYDTSRWSEWVEGLDEVVQVSGPWPHEGATVRWRSGPSGRGEVTERVLAHAAGVGQTVAVRDDAIEAEQTIAFRATADDGVEVRLTLSYALRRRNPAMRLVDLLFVRRAMHDVLVHTLSRFAATLAG